MATLTLNDARGSKDSLYLRRRKTSLPWGSGRDSRPFPSGFTPVVPQAYHPDQPQKLIEARPTFLPPTLLSPLPPALVQQHPDGKASVIGGCRSPKTPISVMSPFRTPNKIIPTIRRICRHVRQASRQPTRSDLHSRSSSPIPSIYNGSVYETSTSRSDQPRSVHPTPPTQKTLSPFVRRRMKSSFSSRGPPSHLDKRSLSPPIVAKTSSSGEIGCLRGRSISTGHNTYEWSSNSSFSSLPSYQLDQDVDPDRVMLDYSSAGRLLRSPLVASNATEPLDYANYLRVAPDQLESVVSPVLSAKSILEPINLTPYLHWPSCESHLTDTVTTNPPPQKLPDSVLDDWTKWRHDLLSKYFPPPCTSPVTHTSD